jgi:hypothetical protein
MSCACRSASPSARQRAVYPPLLDLDGNGRQEVARGFIGRRGQLRLQSR